MVNICPKCQQRYSSSPHNTDFIHECNSGIEALDNEDIVVIGNWTDYTGSGIVSSSVLMTAGTSNELQGTRAGVEGNRFSAVTSRGNRKSTFRTRKHEEYIGDVPKQYD